MTYLRRTIRVLACLLTPHTAFAQGTSVSSQAAGGESGFLVQLASRPDFALWLAVIVLLGITLMFVWGFIATVRRESPRIESHWGGFGGGLGGWRISESLAYLVGAMVFGALFTTVARDLGSPQSASPTGTSAPSGTGSTPPSAPKAAASTAAPALAPAPTGPTSSPSGSAASANPATASGR
jgi:hypothetical protein